MSNANDTPSRKRWPRWATPVTIGVVALLVGVGIGASGKNDNSKTSASKPAPTVTATVTAMAEPAASAATVTQTVTQTATVTATATATITAQPAQAAGPATSDITDGTYQVGVDIAPGIYKTAGSDGTNPVGCYYARLKSLDTQDIISNNITSGPAVVQILPTDKAFTTSSCQPWHKTG